MNDEQNQGSSTGQNTDAPGRETSHERIRPERVSIPSAAPQRRALPRGPSVARELHQVMRGRYALATILGLVVGGAIAAVCWKKGQVEYQSTGLLKISYTLPEVIDVTDQNRPMPMYDTFMTSQKLLITSRRVIDLAALDPIWKASGRPVPIDPERYFADQMTVEVKPRSEFIAITVKDADAATANIAVTAIINAYQRLYKMQHEQLQSQRTAALQSRQAQLETDIQALALQITTSAQEFGTAKLDAFYEAAAARVTKLESALQDVRLAMATARPAKKDEPATGGTAKVLRQPETPDEIAVIDPIMRAYLGEQERLDNDLVKFKALGYGERHPDVIFARASLDSVKGRVSRYAEAFKEFRAVAAQNLGENRTGPVETAGKSLEMLQADEASLQKLHKDAKDEMVALGAKKMELQRQALKREALQEHLEKVVRRMDTLSAESAMGDRFGIVSSGEIPLAPTRDTRIRYAAAGGGAGFLLPVACIAVLGFARRRYWFSDETEAAASSRDVPLLGILPELPATNPDGDQYYAAAQCIHQARVALQTRDPDGGGQVYLASSATASEGKTSLVMSLGLSFAATKLRTLVIDGDFIGRRLTDNLEARELEGFSEALNSGRLEGHVRKTRFGLYVLTAGRGSTRSGCSIGSLEWRALLAEARKAFDVVLIDSGPILGSVEASVLAREVDGILFVIARGQRRGIVQLALRRLEALGVPLAGVMFNRAKRHDFETSAYSSTYASQARNNNGVNGNAAKPPETALVTADRLVRFGPLVQAVVSYLPNQPVTVN